MLSNPAIVTRYALENVLKVGYPCKCHLSPFESETYKAYFTVRDQYECPQYVSTINVVCSNCRSSRTYDVSERYISEFDVNAL